MECQFQADIKPVEVFWKLNEIELSQSDRTEMIYHEDIGLARLIVHQVEPKDSGLYTCTIEGYVREPGKAEKEIRRVSTTMDVQIEGWIVLKCSIMFIFNIDFFKFNKITIY